MVGRHALGALTLALVLTAALAWPLHAPPVSHHGEAREGLVVQNIVHAGDWILPRRNGELPSKPPLFHWLAAVTTLALGTSDAALRLPSALAAFVVSWLTLLLGTTIGGPVAGWLAVGALLGTAPFLAAASEARVDMVFTACVTGALVAFFFWYRQRSPRARAWVYVAAAAAVLAKGPVGALLPALVIVVFLAAQRELGLLRALWSWRLAALVVLIDGGWYLLATARGGREFVELQILRENWRRFVGSHEFRRQARGGTARLAIALATQFLPWSGALVWYAARRLRGIRADVAERFLHVWWITVLALFTVAAGKRPVYLLPLAPALALLAGRALAEAAGAPAAAPRPAQADAGHERGDGDASSWPTPLARVGLAIVLFDIAALGVTQAVRELRAARHSVVAFARTVVERVPADAPLVADPLLALSDRMVLAYYLQRRLPREDATAHPGTFYVIPARASAERWCAGDALVVASSRESENVALMHVPFDRQPRRGDDVRCACSPAAPCPGESPMLPEERPGPSSARPHGARIARGYGPTLAGWDMRRFVAALGGVARAYAGELMTLDAALARAEAANPSLRAAVADLEAARGRLTQAGLPPANPALSGELARHTAPGTDALDRGVALAQEIEVGGQRALRLDAARHALVRAELMVADRRRTVAGEVRRAVAGLVAADRRADLAREAEALAGRLADAARRRAAAGDVGALDVHVAEIEVTRARQASQAAAIERMQAAVRLAAVIGAEPEDEMAVAVPSDVPLVAETVESLVARALAARPDLAGARHEQARLESEAALAHRSGWVPNPVLRGFYREELGDERIAGGEVTLPLPVWNREQGTETALRAAAGAAASEVARLEREIPRQVQLAIVRRRAAADAWAGYERDALPAARATSALVERAYEAAYASLPDVLVQRDRVLQVRVGAVGAWRDLQDAEADVIEALGEEGR